MFFSLKNRNQIKMIPKPECYKIYRIIFWEHWYHYFCFIYGNAAGVRGGILDF